MDAGRLNKRVTIQNRVVAQNGIGEAVTTWAKLASVWASIEPIQGKEFWAQQQVQSEVTVRVRIRYRPGILPSMRLLYGQRVLVIESIINPHEKNEHLQLMCSEGVSDG